MKDKAIPQNWWKLLEAVKHDWGEPEQMDYYDDETKMVRFCKTCRAMLWDWGDPLKDPQYDSCRVMTDWPGDDAPCLCTRRGYLEAHGLI